MIIMGVDYGDVRTGLSVSDKTGFLASPVTVITQRNADKLIDEICKYISELNPELLVVGLPKNMDSTEGERAGKCREFAKNLSEKSGIPCVMRDERLSTVSAHTALSGTNVRGKKRKEIVDAVSAVMILQDYLDYIKNISPEE